MSVQRINFCILLVFFWSFSVWGLENNLLKKIQNNWNNAQQFSINFQQYTKNLQEEVIANGKIYFKKPDLMRWEYKEPDSQLIIVGEKKVWIYDEVLDTVNIQQKEEVLSKSIFYYLLQKNGLFDYFQLLSNKSCKKKLKKEKLFLELCLVPKEPDFLTLALNLGVNNDYQISALWFQDEQTENEFYFKNFQLKKIENNELFQFNKKPSTQIIE